MSGDRSEAGFTLVELLLATVISAIIVGGIASILIVTLESYPRSAAKISLSDNAQLLSSWLVPDVQSAEWTAAGIDRTPETKNCDGTTPPSSINILTLRSTEYDKSGVEFAASYRQVGSELTRYFCKAGALLSTTVVGRDLIAAPNGAIATPTVDSVTISVHTTDLLNGSGSGYDFTVSASRRTPALRIFPVPQLDGNFISGRASTTTIAGTALPNATVNLSIVDGQTPPRTTSPPPITADANGNWHVDVVDINWSSISVVGLDTFNVTSTNSGLTSTATTSTLTSLTPLISAISSSPTNSSPVEFLVAFNAPITFFVPGNFRATGPDGGSLDAASDLYPCPSNSAPGSVCYRVKVIGMHVSDDNGDGAVTLTVPANQVHDAAGNQNVAAVPFSIVWDLNLPVVTPNPPYPTSTDVSFLVRFPYRLVAPPKKSDVSVFATVFQPAITWTVDPAVCPAPVGTSQCFTITVTGLRTDPIDPVSLTAQVNPAKVTDTMYGGLNSQSAVSAPVWWITRLTIAAISGSDGMTTFTGVAAPGPLSLRVCPDQACAVFIQLPDPSVVAGNWTMTASTASLGGYQYAEISQAGQNVFAKIAGP